MIQQVAVANNNKEAEAFLAKNKTEKGVVTTASGLQYRVINAGDKKAPAISASLSPTSSSRARRFFASAASSVTEFLL